MIKTIATMLLALSAFSFDAYSQGASTNPPARIAVINSGAFGDEKAGITKYINALKGVNSSFLPKQNELQALRSRYQTLVKEIEDIRSKVNSGLLKADDKSVSAKVDEADRIQRDLKFKTEDAQVAYDKQLQAATGPIFQAMGKAITDFAKQRGYAVVLDVAKDEKGILLFLDEKTDVTREFITYFNSLP